jgi:hypothetical protein
VDKPLPTTKERVEGTGVALGTLGTLLLVFVFYLRSLAPALLYLNDPNHVAPHSGRRADVPTKKDGRITRRAMLKSLLAIAALPSPVSCLASWRCPTFNLPDVAIVGGFFVVAWVLLQRDRAAQEASAR